MAAQPSLVAVVVVVEAVIYLDIVGAGCWGPTKTSGDAPLASFEIHMVDERLSPTLLD